MPIFMSLGKNIGDDKASDDSHHDRLLMRRHTSIDLCSKCGIGTDELVLFLGLKSPSCRRKRC